MVRTHEWKLVHYLGQPTWGELYDLVHNPEETQNLWDHPHHQAIKATLLATLRDWHIRQPLGLKRDLR